MVPIPSKNKGKGLSLSFKTHQKGFKKIPLLVVVSIYQLAFITFKELAGLESEKAMVVSSANSVKDRREGEECRSLI